MTLPFAELCYNGSVKRVYRDNHTDAVNYFGFTDDYSVFDWGKMPDTLLNKGKALSILGGVFFQKLAQPDGWQALKSAPALSRFAGPFLEALFASESYQTLCQSGLNHHFLGWVSPLGDAVEPSAFAQMTEAPLMKVRHINVHSPRRFTLDQHTLYDYTFEPQGAQEAFLIPLEVVFRFGMPRGSSLEARLAQDPSYYATLGLSHPPAKEAFFNRPIVEFFTKLEPKDRFLTAQEAFLISNLSEAQFHQLYDTVHLLSLWLFNTFAQAGIELWDGKFEFAWTPSGLMLVDSIGPDELRLMYQGVQLSKEVIRQFYKDSDWEKAVREAKVLSQSIPGSDWKTICKEQLLQEPLPLTLAQKQLVQNMYGALVNHFVGEPLLPATKSLSQVAEALAQNHVGSLVS